MSKQNTNDYFTKCGKDGNPLTDCLVIDAHAHIGPFPCVPVVDPSLESIINAMDRIGIDRIYASGSPAIFGQAMYGNNIIIDAMEKYPERIFGYMTLDIGYPETILPEMQRCYSAGMQAVKIWTYGVRPGLPYDHPNYEIIFRFAEEKRLPILAHTWGAEVDQLQKAFNTYKSINWLLAHTGSDDLDKYIQAANEHDNVYLETCLSSCPRGLIELLVAKVPIEKIIWGSDQIFLSMSHQIGRVLFAKIPENDKRKLLGGNAMTVLGKLSE